MDRIVPFLLVLLMVSCKEPQTPQQMLLGNWVVIKDTTKRDSRRGISEDTRGFEFLQDSICDYKAGFVDYNRFINENTLESNNRVLYSLGTKTKYALTNDSLKIFNLSSKEWDNYKIRKLNNDTLIIGNDSRWATFLKKDYNINHVPDFDAVVVSASACLGSCPDVRIILFDNGTIDYKGNFHVDNVGNFTSKISKAEFDKFSLRFKQADYINLKNDRIGVTDGRTVAVSFIKDHKIIKSIEDNGANQLEFYWAYNSVIDLHQTSNFKPLIVPEYLLTKYSDVSYSDNSINYNLTASELYYLLFQLRTGKSTTFNFDEKYELSFDNPLIELVKTDGRYYKFYFKDKTTKTVDIGYNFLTENKLSNTFQKR